MFLVCTRMALCHYPFVVFHTSVLIPSFSGDASHDTNVALYRVNTLNGFSVLGSI